MKNLLLFTILATLLNSCVVEVKIDGCTDSSAINYNPNADNNNGSCDYAADVVFFYDAITANELNGYTNSIYGPIDRLDYYIEDVFVGSEYPGPAFVSAGIPNCYQSTYVTEKVLWGNNNNTTVDYKVIGVHVALLANLNTIVDEYSFDVFANECAAVQVRFLTKKKKE